jgi:hypothetical protein
VGVVGVAAWRVRVLQRGVGGCWGVGVGVGVLVCIPPESSSIARLMARALPFHNFTSSVMLLTNRTLYCSVPITVIYF